MGSDTVLRAYLRSFPLDYGKWSVWKAKERRLGELPFGDSVIDTKFGFKMRVLPNQFVDRFIYYWGQWEPNETRLIQQILQPGDTFLDIGANIGYFTLLGAKRVGAAGKVIAIEATPPTAERLRENVRINGFGNVEVHNCAALDRPAMVTIGGHPTNCGMNSLRLDGSRGASWEVEGRLVDDIVDGRPVRLVKMDIEGAELLAMRGMTRLINRADAPDFVIEIWPEFITALGCDALDIFAIMREAGYQCFWVESGGLEKRDPGDPPERKGTAFFTRTRH